MRYKMDIPKSKDRFYFTCLQKGRNKYLNITKYLMLKNNSKSFKPIFIILSFLSTSAIAQNLQFENYKVSDGLPQSQVYDVMQDSDGFIWFATAAGLSRYDGIRFTNYNHRNADIASDVIFCLEEDDKGNIWAGTIRGGLFRFAKNNPKNRAAFKSFYQQDGIIGNKVYDILKVKDTLWFGTDNATIIKYADSSFSILQLENVDNEKYVRSMVIDSLQRKWVSVFDLGLFLIDGNKITKFNKDSGLPNEQIRAILIDKNGLLWLGGKYGLISAKYESNELKINKIFTVKDGLPSNNIYSLAMNKNILWYSTDKGAGKLSSQGTFINYSTKNGLVNERVLKVFIDRENIIWFATNGGISKLSQERFLYLTTLHGIPFNYITALSEQDDKILIGSHGGGIVEYKNNEIKKPARFDSLKTKMIRVIKKQGNTLWMGGREGFYKFTNNSLIHYTTEDGLAGVYVRSMDFDMQGNIWLGTNKGLSIYNPASSTFNNVEQLKNNSVWFILAARDNSMWVCTNGNGVFRFKNDQITHFSEKDGLKTDNFYSAFETQNGVIWLGSITGAYIFADGKFHFVDEYKELAENSV